MSELLTLSELTQPPYGGSLFTTSMLKLTPFWSRVSSLKINWTLSQPWLCLEILSVKTVTTLTEANNNWKTCLTFCREFEQNSYLSCKRTWWPVAMAQESNPPTVTTTRLHEAYNHMPSPSSQNTYSLNGKIPMTSALCYVSKCNTLEIHLMKSAEMKLYLNIKVQFMCLGGSKHIVMIPNMNLIIPAFMPHTFFQLCFFLREGGW